MALIVEYHVVADMYPIAEDTTISAGMIAALDSNGFVVPAPTGTDPDQSAIGIAGDSNVSNTQTTAYSAQVTIGATDSSTARNRWTSNRVSDMYNETLAAGKITVYNGGGKFWISDDLFDDSSSVTVGNALGISGSTAGEWEESSITNDDIIAVAVGTAKAYSSGVPGTDTADGSIELATLGSNEWIPVILRI